jgi:hypothetical protein
VGTEAKKEANTAPTKSPKKVENEKTKFDFEDSNDKEVFIKKTREDALNLKYQQHAAYAIQAQKLKE